MCTNLSVKILSWKIPVYSGKVDLKTLGFMPFFVGGNARSVIVIIGAIAAILFTLTRSTRMFLGPTVLACVECYNYHF